MKFRLTIVLCISFTKLVFSQAFDKQQRISIPSPNVMSFAVFDNFPAVPNTGIPDISIPVYDFKYREISIPINLRYNINLVKPDIQPSWAGLGWNLDVGGQITRVVNDKPDDLQYADNFIYNKTGEANVGYWYNHSFFKNEGWNNEIKVKAAADDWRNYPDYIANLGYPASVKDYQPDDFVFSFLGINGKFYLDADRKWKVKCNQKIRVEVNTSDVSAKGFSKITLTDTKGTKYIFGENENAIEYANSLFFTYKQRVQAKSWNLSKIILKNSEEIVFNYKKVHPSVSAIPSFFSNIGVTPGFANGGMLYAGSVTVPSYLETIIAPNGEIQFNSSNSVQLGFDRNKFAYMEKRIAKTYIDAMNSVWIPGSYIPNWDFENNVFPVPNRSNMDDYVSTTSLIGLKLDEISIKNKSDEVKLFKFSYTNDATERLKLLKFETQNKNSGIKLNTFQFSYNSLKLPEYLSSKTDHWGFYNGKLLDISSSSAFYNSKLPDPEYAKAEVLNKVEYPAGGYSTYEFEGHSYSKELDTMRSNPLINYNQDKITGGLRIKKITNFNIWNQIANSKEYKYVNGYSLNSQNQLSSGVLVGKSIYHLNILANGSISSLNVQSIFPLSNNANGSHIAYSEVVEKYAEGYQVNYYSNFDTGIDGEYMDGAPDFSIGASNQTYNERDFERGLLLMRGTFTNTGVLVSKNQIKYDRIIGENDFVKNIKAGVIGTVVPGNPSASTFTGYKGTCYKKFTHAYLPIEEINTSYDFSGANPVSTIKKYEYDLNTKNLKSESLLNSKNEQISTTYAYANQFDLASNTYNQMVNANMIGVPIEIKKYKGQTPVLIESTLNTFKGSNNILPYKTFVFTPSNTTNLISTTGTQDSLLYDNQYLEKINYDSYDVLGNIQNIFIDRIKNNCYLYSYKNQYPIAEIKNASFWQVTSILKLSNIISFGGLTEPTSAQITNFLAPLKNNLLLKDAQITSYTYKPLVGITSQTDPKGQTTYYGYDSFQRLKFIKDQSGNIIKSFCYNYAGQNINCTTEFKNTAKSQAFTRYNCTSGQQGSSVTYTVAAGTYSSSLSQADADQLALNDIAANGQNYANAQGQCTFTFNLNYSIPGNKSFLLEFYNTQTNQRLDYVISNNGSSSSNTLENIPQGTYTVSINESNYSGTYSFYLNSQSKTGTRVSFPAMTFTTSQSLYVTTIN